MTGADEPLLTSCVLPGRVPGGDQTAEIRESIPAGCGWMRKENINGDSVCSVPLPCRGVSVC